MLFIFKVGMLPCITTA